MIKHEHFKKVFSKKYKYVAAPYHYKLAKVLSKSANTKRKL